MRTVRLLFLVGLGMVAVVFPAFAQLSTPPAERTHSPSCTSLEECQQRVYDLEDQVYDLGSTPATVEGQTTEESNASLNEANYGIGVGFGGPFNPGRTGEQPGQGPESVPDIVWTTTVDGAE